MIAGMSYYQILWFFIIYSFLGWVLEVIYHAVHQGKVINRGFLNGPVCPVYGFGVLAVFALINVVKPGEGMELSPGLVYLIGVILTTAIELFAGWILDIRFHARWWDYRDRPFNFKGYICLEFSLLWGVAVLLVVEVAQPFIERYSASLIPEKYGYPILAVLYIIYLVDFVVTVMTINGLNKQLKELDEIQGSMRGMSDALTNIIGETALQTTAKVEEGKVQAKLAREELKSATESAVNAAEQQVQEMKQAAQDLREAASQQVQDMKDAASQQVQDMKDAASQQALDMREAAGQQMQDMREAAEEAAQDMRQAVYQARKQHLENRQRTIQANLLKSPFGSKRLLRAFPGMRHEKYNEVLSDLRNQLRANIELAKNSKES